MGKPKRTIDDVDTKGDTYDSDGGFVSDDDGQVKKSKKSKKVKTTNNSPANPFWSLSNGRQPRRVELSEFKGTTLINIREFYEKDDQYLPGKKGISLSLDQYKAFLKAIPEINSKLKKAGNDVSGNAVEDDDEDEEEEEVKPRKKREAKATTSKANIDATSDEEEEEE